MNIEDIIYAAGLFDGEGTVTLTRMEAGKYRSPMVSLASTTRELCEFMKETFGGHLITLTRNAKLGHKQAWHWQASRNRAIDTLTCILPYLREPEKIRRGNMIVQRFKSVTPRNGKYSDELKEARVLFEEEFFVNSSKA